LNARSLTSKVDELQAMTSVLNPQVIAVTESWLNDSIEDSFIAITNYSSPFRRDRQGRTGGGVCCYIRNDLSCSILPNMTAEPNYIECLWLRLWDANIILAVVYIPPALSPSQYHDITQYLTDCADLALDGVIEGQLIFTGDFNRMPINDLTSQLNLVQMVNSPTRGDAILDLILVDPELKQHYLDPITGPNLGKSDHLSVLLRPVSNDATDNQLVSVHKVIDFRGSNLKSLYLHLFHCPWHLWYRSNDNVQLKADTFYNWIDEAISKLPCSYVALHSSDKAWVTPLIKHLLNCKYRAFYDKDFPRYRHFKKKVKSEIARAKAKWVDNLKSHPNGIWKLLNDLNGNAVRKNEGLAKLVNSFPSVQHAAESVNNHFCASFSEPPDWNKLMTQLPIATDPWICDVSVLSVYNQLCRLNSRKATGSDGIPARLLKECAAVLAEPISHLYSLSLESQQIPSQWKLAHIIPVPKRKVSSLDDTRPISLLPVLFKVFESLIVASVKTKLVHSYGYEQFGFRPQSSTLLAHIAMNDFVASNLDKSSVSSVAVISFDMSRAFDKLKHPKLLLSLCRHELPSSFILWCCNFLQLRTQRVKLMNVLSSSRSVTSGVPQGSLLSPYLFSSHMSSLLPASSHAKIFKYADDVLIFCPIFKNDDVESIFHIESCHLKSWCDENGLTVNESKTNVMLVNKGYKPLPSVSLVTVPSLRILGVLFHENFKWDSHIDNVVKVASRRIHVLRRLKQTAHVTKEDLIAVYFACIRSILEYNCPLFAGFSVRNARKLDIIQKRCHRIICSFDCRCKILSDLSERRKVLCIRTLKKILRDENIIHYLAPPVLQHSKQLSVPYCKTHRHASTFIPFATILYNRSCS
jgi:hypothetical protein